jgi:uncharacterized protein (TIGR01777 family)
MEQSYPEFPADRQIGDDRGMRVVVPGGTGFLGSRLVARLAARGDEVIVLSRSEMRRAQARPEGKGRGAPRTSFAAWTPKEPGPWQRAIEEADAVVSLAGAGVMDEPWSERRMEELRASRVVSTRLVAEAVARGRKAVLVSASGIGIYGMRTDDVELDESAPVGTDVLADLCAKWEDATAPAKDAGARVVLARIGIALGRGGGAFEEMSRPYRFFVGGPLGGGKQWVSWVHVDDVVSALVHSIDARALEGAVNVSAPEPVRMDDFARALGRAWRRPAFLRVPSFAVRAMLGERADVLLTGQRVRPRRLAEERFAFAFPRLDDALADILAS